VRGYAEDGNEDDGASRYFNMDGPMVMMGRPGEKPEIITSNRPSSNWKDLIKLGISGAAGTASLSYLAVSKDYSNVNYSSARAAMNQDWKVVVWYRGFMGNYDSQPFFDMLIEEAYLRGEWTPPAGAPGFYEARDLWTSVQWIGPARGYMDPVKEIEADIRAVESKLATRHEIMAANGRDFDDDYPILLAEHQQMLALGVGNEHPAGDADGRQDGSSLAGGVADAPDGDPARPSDDEENKKDDDDE
jgi:capsid protein